MNQLENKVRTNRNGNGSQIAGVETSADSHVMADQVQADQAQLDQAQTYQAPVDQGQSDPHFSLRSLRAEAEIYAISRTLEYTGWNRRRAAQLLSISYRGILYKIRQHNLTPGAGREVSVLEQTVKVE
jgi:DNA-binding NtrC family response regulator